MRPLTRLVVGGLLSIGLASVTACSFFSSTECGGETETELLSQLLVESGAPTAALLGARYDNNPLVLAAASMVLSSSSEEQVALVKAAKSIVASKGSAIALRGIITKEKKSRRSVVCSADAFLADTAPPLFPTDSDSSKAWKGASATHWSVIYTAELTDKGDEVYVRIQNADCLGPACDLVTKLADVGKKLQSLNLDEVLEEAAKESENAAISTLRAINSAQSTFASACGKGFYARTLKVLLTPPEGEREAFLSEDLRPTEGEARLRRWGYDTEVISPSDGAALAPPCNGLPPETALSSTYRLLACPQAGGPGKRCFASDADGTISAGPSRNGPWEPVK